MPLNSLDPISVRTFEEKARSQGVPEKEIQNYVSSKRQRAINIEAYKTTGDIGNVPLESRAETIYTAGQQGYTAPSEKERDPLAPQKRVALEALDLLETRYGRGDTKNIGTKKDIALAGGGGNVERLGGLIQRGLVTAGSDPKLREDIQSYQQLLITFLPAFTQAFGSGAPQEGEAKRLIEAAPGAKSSDREAAAWFNDVRVLLGGQLKPNLELEKDKKKIEGEPSVIKSSFISEPTLQPTLELDDNIRPEWSDLPRNIIPSAQKNANDLIAALSHPIELTKGIGGIFAGLGEKASMAVGLGRGVPESWAQEPKLDALVGFYKNRYGSTENARNAIIQDPIGVALDVLTIVSVGGGAIAKVGPVSKAGIAGKITSGAGKAAEIANALDPIQATFSAGSAALSKISRFEKNIGIIPKAAEQLDIEAISEAKKIGVELPLGASTKNQLIQSAEALVQKGFWGKNIADKYEAGFNKLDELNKNIVNNIDTTTDLQATGKAIKKGMDDYVSNYRKHRSELYDSVPETIKRTPATFDDTKNTLGSIIDSKSKSLVGENNLDFYRNLKDKLGDNITYENLKQTRTDIGQKLKSTDPVTTGDKASLERLYASLSNDLDNSIKIFDPDAYNILQQANKFYKIGLENINGSVGKKIAGSTPEKIIDSIIKPNTPSDVSLLKELAGEKWPDIQASFMAKIFSESIDEGLLNLKKLKSGLEKYGDPTLKEILSSDQQLKLSKILDNMETIENVKSALKRGQKTAGGSQTAFIAGNVAATATFLITNPLIGLKYILGQYLLSKLFTTEFGRKLLTSTKKVSLGGLEKPAEIVGKAGTPVRIGRLGAQGLSEEPPDLNQP